MSFNPVLPARDKPSSKGTRPLHASPPPPPPLPQVWSELDPHASGFIRAPDLPLLIMELHPPLGNRDTRSMAAGAQDIILSVDIPNRGNRVRAGRKA